MSRIAIIVAAALAFGAIMFTIAAPETAQEGPGLADVSGDAAAEMADAASQMRLCLGPARITLGGEPFMGLAFGGDGCNHSAANLVGFRILRGPTVPRGPVLGFRLPTL